MEFLDIVNDQDEVIGTASKDEVYQKSLCHRIVHVLIFNDAGEMALQLRSADVSFCPGHWSTAAGGHVQSGESYEQGAVREYEEELGTASALEELGKDFYHADQSPNKFLVTYKTIFNGSFHPDPKVVQRVDFFPIVHIKKMIEQGDAFHPELLFLLKRYFF